MTAFAILYFLIGMGVLAWLTFLTKGAAAPSIAECFGIPCFWPLVILTMIGLWCAVKIARP